MAPPIGSVGTTPVKIPKAEPQPVIAETKTEAQQPAKSTGWGATGQAGGRPAPVAGPSPVQPQASSGKIDNGFKYELSGGDPVATGSFWNQTKQAATTASQGIDAAKSVVTGGLLPPDFVKRAQLRSLSTIPPIAGQPTAKAVYTSHANCSPQKAYDQFTKKPAEMFAAAGLKLRPATTELKDGARAFIEDKGPPPVWAGVEFKLDPANNKVTVTTLDGHPLRGTNEFHFQSDGKGGTNFVQTSNFQGSSPLVEVGKKMGAIDRQHGIWEAIHQNIASVK